MHPLFFVRDALSRAVYKKIPLILLAAGMLLFAIAGMLFCRMPEVYDHNAALCRRVAELLHADRKIAAYCFERLAERLIALALITLSGVHRAGLFVTPAALAFRACILGGTVVVFVGSYGILGVLIVLALTLPTGLLNACLECLAAALAFERAGRFRVCGHDLRELCADFCLLAAGAAAVCLAETVLLFLLVRPIGSLF